MYRSARRWELVDRNPIELVRQGSRRLRIPRVLTAEEIRLLLAELSDPYHTMVLVARMPRFAGQRNHRSPVGRFRLGQTDGSRPEIRRAVPGGRDENRRFVSSAASRSRPCGRLAGPAQMQ